MHHVAEGRGLPVHDAAVRPAPKDHSVHGDRLAELLRGVCDPDHRLRNHHVEHLQRLQPRVREPDQDHSTADPDHVRAGRLLRLHRQHLSGLALREHLRHHHHHPDPEPTDRHPLRHLPADQPEVLHRELAHLL